MTSEAGGLLWKLIPALMCELLVGLGEVDLVGIDDPVDGPLGVVIRCRKARPVCEGRGGLVCLTKPGAVRGGSGQRMLLRSRVAMARGETPHRGLLPP